MRSNPSQGRLSFWQVGSILAIPTLVAVTGGIWLAAQALNVKSDQAELLRSHEVSSQARAVADSIWDAMDSIRARAIALYHVQAARTTQANSAGGLAPAPIANQFSDDHLVLWAEVEKPATQGAGFKIVSILRNSNAVEANAIDEKYLENALRYINLTELGENGLATLRLKQDPHRNNEWMGMLFTLQEPANRAILALVDPATAFPVFQRWAQRSEGSTLRAYLVGKDGFVLAHSQKTYVGADFSRISLFQNAVREMLLGRRTNGSGTYQAIDETHVTAAYLRPGTLPIGVVVEKVVSPTQASSGAMMKALLNRVAGQAFMMLGALIFFVAACAWLIHRRALRVAAAAPDSFAKVMASQATAKAADRTIAPAAVADEIDELAALEKTLAEMKSTANEHKQAITNGAAEPKTENRTETETATETATAAENRSSTNNDSATPFFRIQEMPPSDIARMTRDNGTPDAVGNMVDSQMIEASLYQEFNTDAQMSLEAHEKRVAMARFETDLGYLSAPQKLAQRVTNFAHEMSHSPVLFFGYHATSKSATLEAFSAFNPNGVKSALAFGIGEDVAEAVAKSAKQGQIRSLSDYPPLVALMKKLRTVKPFKQYRAWAMTGGENGEMVGVLVILDGGEKIAENSELLARVIRNTGQFYENAIKS